jgi:hypothetical protein
MHHKLFREGIKWGRCGIFDKNERYEGKGGRLKDGGKRLKKKMIQKWKCRRLNPNLSVALPSLPIILSKLSLNT